MKYQKKIIYTNTLLISCLAFSNYANAQEYPSGSTLTGIATKDNDVSIADDGQAFINNNGGANIAAVEVVGGNVNLGNNSVITAKGFGANAVGGMMLNGGKATQSSNFTSNNLTINVSSTVGNASKSSVIGLGSNYTADNGPKGTINLNGTTNINLDVSDNSTTTSVISGVFVSGSNVSVNADELNVGISYKNTVKPSDSLNITGIYLSRATQNLAYNSAKIIIDNSTANTIANGILNTGKLIEGTNTAVTLNGAAGGQTLKGITATKVSDDADMTSLIVLSGKTNIDVNSGGNNSNLIAINSNAALGQFSQKMGDVVINLDSKGFANNTVNGIYTESGLSSIKNIDIDTNSLTITNKNNVTADSHFVYANGGNIELTTAGALNFIDEAKNNQGINDIIKAGQNGTVTINAQEAKLAGNIVAQANGSVDFNANTGTFTGTTQQAAGSTVNFGLGDGFVWNMTDNSTLSDLSLNNSTVNFNKEKTNSLVYQVLTADNLKGNGTFNLRTDIIGQQGDLVVVKGSAEGAYKLGIANNGAASTNGNETLTVVKAGTNNADFSLVNKVELGAYEYGLRKVDGSQDLEFYALVDQNNGNDIDDGDNDVNNGDNGGNGVITTTAEAASSFLNIGYLTNYIDNQTLLQRLGDLRNGQIAGINNSGLWLRGFGGKLNSFSGQALSGFDMTYVGTQLGVDKQIEVTNGNLLVGTMVGFTETNPNYRKGDGNGKNYNIGLYATYFLDDSLYVDSVLEYNHMRNRFNVEDTAGKSVYGTGKTKGIMASIEVGKRFWMNITHQGFYLEPQAQFSYGYQSGDTVRASNELNVDLSHYKSALGRASAIFGYQIQGENPINVYLKTGMVREMSGDASYRFNDGRKNEYSFRANWFDNGIGANININKKHKIYAEADYSLGNRFNNTMLNVGYRYSF